MAKSRKRTRTDNVVRMPGAEISDSDIARRAYEIYCERGRQHGHDLDDWLQAERELRGLVNSAVA